MAHLAALSALDIGIASLLNSDSLHWMVVRLSAHFRLSALVSGTPLLTLDSLHRCLAAYFGLSALDSISGMPLCSLWTLHWIVVRLSAHFGLSALVSGMPSCSLRTLSADSGTPLLTLDSLCWIVALHTQRHRVRITQ